MPSNNKSNENENNNSKMITVKMMKSRRAIMKENLKIYEILKNRHHVTIVLRSPLDNENKFCLLHMLDMQKYVCKPA